MHNRFQTPSILCRSTVLFVCSLMGLLLIGCAEQGPHLETTTVTSALDQPGVCGHCKKEIEKMTEEHLITVRGNQHIVCDEKCEVDLKEWLAKQ
jgi:hypothetical protein